MKSIGQKIYLLLFCIFTATSACGYDFEVDGLYYSIRSIEDLTCTLVEGDNVYTGDIVIPSQVTYKGKTLTVTGFGCTFSYNKYITSVTIPNSVSEISLNAFLNCTSLKHVVIPNTVTSIESGVFQGCSSLNEITIPNSILTIYTDAFAGSGLKTLIIEDGEKTLFYRNLGVGISATSFNTVEILYLGRNIVCLYKDYPIFSSNLKEVTVGNLVTKINPQLFASCHGLTSLKIPDSVAEIGEGAFEDCSSLTDVTLETSVIGERAFKNCSSLTDVTLGSSVDSIDALAFNNCPNLTRIYSLNPMPPECDNSVFDNKIYLNTNLYVPTGSLATYQKADTWKNFWTIEEVENTGVSSIRTESPRVVYEGDGIRLTGASGKSLYVYSTSGKNVYMNDRYSGEIISLLSGIYIVKVGDDSLKVSVK